MGIRVALAVCAVFVAISSACSGDDPSPSSLPSTPSVRPSSPTGVATPTPSAPTSTPTPTPPVQPALARQDSPAGAEAFARYWLTTLDYAYKTGDTKPFRALATSDCKTCANFAASITKFYAEGGRLTGGHFRAEEARTVRHIRGSAALVDLVYSRSAGRADPGAGAPTSFPTERNVEVLMALGRRAGFWRAVSVKSVKRR